MTSSHNPRRCDTAICCGKRKNYKRYKGEDEEEWKAKNGEARENEVEEIKNYNCGGTCVKKELEEDSCNLS
jgi:hypothetical protein